MRDRAKLSEWDLDDDDVKCVDKYWAWTRARRNPLLSSTTSSRRRLPAGGGCRKNRRGKSFRILTDRLASKGLASDPDPDPRGSALADSATTSSGLHDASASNIDLALVYANFLNQKPEPKSTGFEMPELPCEFHPSFQLSSTLSTSNTSLDSSHIQLPPDTHLSEDNQVYLSGFHPIHTHHDHDSANIYGLPPLPGQEVASPEMLWPISQAMVQNQTLHETQLPALHPEAAQHPNHVAVTAGNWSPFDLSCYETFSRPWEIPFCLLFSCFTCYIILYTMESL